MSGGVMTRSCDLARAFPGQVYPPDRWGNDL